jgi:hypothetical protein
MKGVVYFKALSGICRSKALFKATSLQGAVFSRKITMLLNPHDTGTANDAGAKIFLCENDVTSVLCL